MDTQCSNCNGIGIFDTCAEYGGPRCVYCTFEEGSQNILSGKNCSMCNGTGKFDSTQTLCIGKKRIVVDVKSTVNAKLTQETKAEIAESFLNSNITDWECDGEQIHYRYSEETKFVNQIIPKQKTF